MCSNEQLKIIGDSEKGHHDKNISDNRISITVLRVGSAAGTHGPLIFIAKGLNINITLGEQNLRQKYGLPEGSVVLYNESAYKDDVTWDKVVV